VGDVKQDQNSRPNVPYNSLTSSDQGRRDEGVKAGKGRKRVGAGKSGNLILMVQRVEMNFGATRKARPGGGNCSDFPALTNCRKGQWGKKGGMGAQSHQSMKFSMVRKTITVSKKKKKKRQTFTRNRSKL